MRIGKIANSAEYRMNKHVTENIPLQWKTIKIPKIIKFRNCNYKIIL